MSCLRGQVLRMTRVTDYVHNLVINTLYTHMTGL